MNQLESSPKVKIYQKTRSNLTYLHFLRIQLCIEKFDLRITFLNVIFNQLEFE